MDSTKLRRCKSARPDLAKRSRSRTETHWDPWDPVVLARSQQMDAMHWSQMRSEAYKQAQQKASWMAGNDDHSAEPVETTTSARETSWPTFPQQRPKTAANGINNNNNNNNNCNHGNNNNAPPIRSVTFAPSPKPALQIQPSWTSSKLNTGFNQRARQGFVYWYTPRPKPTLYGRYSLGARHMQYGLCMAPRS